MTFDFPKGAPASLLTTAVFMSLDHSQGEAFGQLIIGFYRRLSSECFAPTFLTRNLNQNVVYLGFDE
ncbi:MAG: hypothetical protein ACKPE3_11880 [Sphaerospermopsis kisseleviana]